MNTVCEGNNDIADSSLESKLWYLREHAFTFLPILRTWDNQTVVDIDEMFGCGSRQGLFDVRSELNSQATLVVEAEMKPAQPLLLTYQQVPDYNEVSNGQRGLMQYPEFAFDVLKQIPREFEQEIMELPEIPFHERILFEQAKWLHEDIADLDRKSRVLVYNYTDLASEVSEVEEFMVDEVLSSSEVESEDVPLELLHRGMQATQCQQWQSQDHRCVTEQEQPQVKLTSLKELEEFAENETGKPADSLRNYWLNKTWFDLWLLGNGLDTQYYVDMDSLPGEEGITNILRRHDSENVVIMDLGTDLEEGLSRLVSYFSGSIESGWNQLCDYDAEAEADPEFAVDKQWLDSLKTERELFDAMVARQEKDQLDSDKHDIYNALDMLWAKGERFTVDSAFDLLVSIGVDFLDRRLVKEVAADVLSVVQPRKQSAPLQEKTNILSNRIANNAIYYRMIEQMNNGVSKDDAIKHVLGLSQYCDIDFNSYRMITEEVADLLFDYFSAMPTHELVIGDTCFVLVGESYVFKLHKDDDRFDFLCYRDLRQSRSELEEFNSILLNIPNHQFDGLNDALKDFLANRLATAICQQQNNVTTM